jgi:hypothetical protein
MFVIIMSLSSPMLKSISRSANKMKKLEREYDDGKISLKTLDDGIEKECDRIRDAYARWIATDKDAWPADAVYYVMTAGTEPDEFVGRPLSLQELKIIELDRIPQ